MISESKGSVNQRINLVVNTFEKGVKSAFATKIGISAQGVHDLLSGRKGSPSFKVLSSILESYPALDANWLVLGRGPMLRSDAAEAVLKEAASMQIEGKTMKETIADYIRSGEMRAEVEKIMDDSMARNRDKELAIRQVYAVAKKYPYGPAGQLSVRLGVTEEEAKQLILDGKIQASDLGKLGFRVSEQAVRDFLGQE